MSDAYLSKYLDEIVISGLASVMVSYLYRLNFTWNTVTSDEGHRGRWLKA